MTSLVSFLSRDQTGLDAYDGIPLASLDSIRHPFFGIDPLCIAGAGSRPSSLKGFRLSETGGGHTR
jgi:hypothetical protein